MFRPRASTVKIGFISGFQLGRGYSLRQRLESKFLSIRIDRVFRTRSTQVCREYTKEAEDFFQKPPMSANDEGASTSDIDDDIEENEAESSTDEKPVLSLGRGRSRLRSRYFRLHCVKYV